MCWHLQIGSIAIPGSSNPDHIEENYDVFDFELKEEEMQQIGTLDTGKPSYDVYRDSSAEPIDESLWEVDFNAQE